MCKPVGNMIMLWYFICFRYPMLVIGIWLFPKFNCSLYYNFDTSFSFKRYHWNTNILYWEHSVVINTLMSMTGLVDWLIFFFFFSFPHSLFKSFCQIISHERFVSKIHLIKFFPPSLAIIPCWESEVPYFGHGFLHVLSQQ